VQQSATLSAVSGWKQGLDRPHRPVKLSDGILDHPTFDERGFLWHERKNRHAQRFAAGGGFADASMP